MASKRKHDEDDNDSIGTESKQVRTSVSDILNEYRGFSLQNDENKWEIPLEDGKIGEQEFFDKYVAKRKPCVINSLPKLASGKFPILSLEELKEVAGEKMVQVERRFATVETFGQNRTASRQILMTMTEFLEKLKKDDGALFYLSTQESESNDPFQVPTRELLDRDYIASHVPWAGNLILHSCNLWVGTSRNGASSGLHHDYHDNFYLLMRGRKRFRIYSPDCAPFMYTYGEIAKVHSNGRISYIGSETRADGVPLTETASSNEGEDEHQDSDESVDDEDEIILGKGFEYKSDSDSGGDFDGTKDDYDEIMGKSDLEEQGRVEQRPDSFSRINVEILGDRAAMKESFPLFSICRECIIELKAGQTLYLPAGWFHEVTSGNEAKCDNHTALNYWYHPPDSVDSFEQPYKQNFWSEQLKNEDN